MALGKLFKSLFSASSDAQQSVAADPVNYKEFVIEAAPINDDGKFRIAGFISGDKDGETRRIQFIRADQINDKQLAIDKSVSKARQIIDEQGNKLLDKSHL
jgi:hypothetical protein